MANSNGKRKTTQVEKFFREKFPPFEIKLRIEPKLNTIQRDGYSFSWLSFLLKIGDEKSEVDLRDYCPYYGEMDGDEFEKRWGGIWKEKQEIWRENYDYVKNHLCYAIMEMVDELSHEAIVRWLDDVGEGTSPQRAEGWKDFNADEREAGSLVLKRFLIECMQRRLSAGGKQTAAPLRIVGLAGRPRQQKSISQSEARKQELKNKMLNAICKRLASEQEITEITRRSVARNCRVSEATIKDWLSLCGTSMKELKQEASALLEKSRLN